MKISLQLDYKDAFDIMHGVQNNLLFSRVIVKLPAQRAGLAQHVPVNKILNNFLYGDFIFWAKAKTGQKE
jgi:hypothetical protein